MEWNENIFTDELPFGLQHHDGRIRVWRHLGERLLNYYVMQPHTGPVPSIMIELLPWPACPLNASPIEYVRSMLAQRMARDTTPDQLWQYVKICDESVRNLSTDLLRRLFGEYKFAFISNQLQKDERDMQNR
ncbi:hypothetical protein TNCV_4328751 [Trichonephila clavipes]|nr:hypothetical protein TNCV_4328751 [Trichonephila clavipes]